MSFPTGRSPRGARDFVLRSQTRRVDGAESSSLLLRSIWFFPLLSTSPHGDAVTSSSHPPNGGGWPGSCTPEERAASQRTSGVRPAADLQTAKPHAIPLRSSSPLKRECPREVSLRESEVGAGTDAAPWGPATRSRPRPNGPQVSGYNPESAACARPASTASKKRRMPLTSPPPSAPR